MANVNPIRPIGNVRSLDVFEAARRQDEERRIREDDIHFRRTGENRLPLGENSPLVEENPSQDVANDGDDYDEANGHFQRYHNNIEHSVDGEYVEDSPTRILQPDDPRVTRRNNEDLLSLHGIDASVERNLFNGQRQQINASRTAREAYLRREREIEDKKQAELEEKTKQKFKNSISGLEIGDE